MKYACKRVILALGALLLFSSPVWAEEEWDFAGLIGMSPAEAVEKLGPPSEIYPVRGQREDQDEVVLYYPGKLYLFFINQRVWQLRMDDNSELGWKSVKTGASRSEVEAVFGEPYFSTSDWEVFLIPGGRWPLRLRVFYRNNGATDFYLYRGDL